MNYNAIQGKLADEREKAKNYLQIPSNPTTTSPGGFNLSDLRQDKTLYMDKTPCNSPFNTREISARSTIFSQNSQAPDFDEIMKTSHSKAVRDRYQEKKSMGRFSSLPLTADMSARTSMSSQIQKDFWDVSQPSYSSFIGKNLTYSNEDFRPAEEMAEQFAQDEKDQDMEYADIPGERARDVSNWEEQVSRGRLPEMSFGRYCSERVQPLDIREIYGKPSPKKNRENRQPLFEVSTNESVDERLSNFDSRKLEKFIKSNTAPSAESLLRNYNKGLKPIHENVATNALADENKVPLPKIVCDLMENMSFEKVMENAHKERARMAEAEKDRTNLDMIPVKDDTIADNEENDDIMNDPMMSVPGRGMKRRSSAVTSETPRSTLGKCLRTKSPNNIKEIQAAKLKPKVLPDDSLFKVPYTSDSTWKSSSGASSMSKSPHGLSSFQSQHGTSSILQQDSTSREYLTAKENFSIRTPDEKLSLPNYALQRPPAITSSPSSSLHSQPRWSPTGNPHGRLRRSVSQSSQMSNGSEYGENDLPLRIKNIENRMISFESVKLNKSAIKSFSIQNGSDKKLALRVAVTNHGFSVSPSEDFRMVPMEARTFQVKFSPQIIGPYRGALTFQLITNKHISKSIPLRGYGGHAHVSIEGVQKGPFGPQFITMGLVKHLNCLMEQTFRLRNNGTLPAFASIAIEKTKLRDLSLHDSFSVDPTEVKIDPEEFADIKVCFKATKADFRKIAAVKKEVITISQLCVVTGDEPTRLRLLQGKERVENEFLNRLPSSLPGEHEIAAKIVRFKEELTEGKINTLASPIKVHEIVLTVNRDMEDTQCMSAQISIANDTNMSFETFIETNCTKINNAVDDFDHSQQMDMEMYESKFFRIFPTEIIYKRRQDQPGSQKLIEVESISEGDLYVEAISSNSKLVSVSLSRGKIKKGEIAEIRVTALSKAFEQFNPIKIIILIKDARVEIPVKFIE